MGVLWTVAKGVGNFGFSPDFKPCFGLGTRKASAHLASYCLNEIRVRKFLHVEPVREIQLFSSVVRKKCVMRANPLLRFVLYCNIICYREHP